MAIWNLNNLYKEEEKEALISNLKEKVDEFKKIELKNITPEDFIQLIKIKEELSQLSSIISARISLKLVEDTSNQKIIADENQLSLLMTEISNELLYYSIWFKSLSDEEAEKFILKSGDYAPYLKNSRKFKDYMLSEKEEKLINIKDLTGSEELTKLYDIITNKFSFDWQGEKITREQLITKVRSLNREDRVNAYNLLLSQYEEESTVLGELYSGIVRDWINENVSIRGFKSPISVRNLGNDISDKAVKVLLNVVRKKSDVFHRYFKLKSKMVGHDLDRYDIYMPLTQNDEKYDYDKSKEIVLSTFKEFDNSFYEAALKVFEEKHIHSEIVKNKRGGAFCYMINTKITPYVMLNHTGELEDVFTMMHELGHAAHDIFASRNNDLVAHPTLPLAETASIFSEMILSKRLLKESNIKTKKNILFRLLEGQFASILRQTYFVIFEEKAHDLISKGASTSDLDIIYHDLLKEQFGPLTVPDCFKHEWKYIPHIYHSPFYCYAYAFGNLLVLALYKKYELEGKSFINKYKDILSKGGSDSPINILKEVGIDIEDEKFWESGFDVIIEEIDLLESL